MTSGFLSKRRWRRGALSFLFGAFALPAMAQVGGLDAGFQVPAILNGDSPGIVRSLVTQSDGKVLIAGEFTTVGGAARGGVARLLGHGALDPSFAPASAGANGAVHALAVQPDGKVLIGGAFTAFDGTSRSRLARLTEAGVLDTTFNPGAGANGSVHALMVAGQHTYVGGDFTAFNGVSRSRIARLFNSGSLDMTFTAGGGANGTVYALAASDYSGSTLYAGGAFTTFGGQARSRLAAFSTFSSGMVDASYNAAGGPNGTVHALLRPSSFFGPGGSFVIAGEFTTVSGYARARLALVGDRFGFSQTLPVDAAFNVWADAPVRCLAMMSGTQMLIGGDFSMINGVARGRFARLVSRGSGTSWDPMRWDVDAKFHADSGADAAVLAIGATADGKAVLGGRFGAIGGAAAPTVARLYGDAGSQPPAAPGEPGATAASAAQIIVTWNGVAHATAYQIERSPDGANDWSVLGTGRSPFIDGGLAAGTPYFYRVRARSSNGDGAASAVVSATTFAQEWTGAGALDPAAKDKAGTDNSISAVAVQEDGKIVIAGSFSTVHGVPRSRVARLLPDWSVDPAFDPGAGPASTVAAVAVQADGKLVIGGSFTTVAGATRNYIARLHADGTLDTSFDPGAGPNSSVWALAMQGDGKVLIGGNFSTVAGVARNNLARLHSDGALDSSFQAVVYPSGVDSLSVQRDGRILVGGSFWELNGADRYGFGRLTADGATDPTFLVGDGAFSVDQIIASNKGGALLAGFFSRVNLATRNRVARVLSDGSVDTAFDPGAGPNGTVSTIAPQPDGKVLIGGSFTEVGTAARLNIARLNADGTLDESFHSGTGTNGQVQALALAPDGSIVAGGTFSTVAGVPQGNITRLVGDRFSEPPPAPAGLTAATHSSSTLELSWSDLPAEHGWKLERSANGASGWEVAARLPWDVSSYRDSGLAAGTVYHYRLRAWNPAGDSPFSATAQARTLSAFEQWKRNVGVPPGTSADADSDGDGSSTLMEYALGLDPTRADTQGHPVPQIIGDTLTLSYRRLRPELSYVVEASTDLQSWSAAEVNQGSGTAPTAWTPIGLAPRKFLRLRVAQP